MKTDTIPLPSKGVFYNKNKYNEVNDYIEVGYLTTEDELSLTSPNLFNKGDALYRVLKNKIEPFNEWLDIDELLVYDRDYILLWLRDNAYGSVIEDVTDTKDIYFDSYNMEIKFLEKEPDKDYHYVYNIDGDELLIKPITIFEERYFKAKSDRLNYYIAHIKSINGIRDKEKISKMIKYSKIEYSRKVKKFIDSIVYGVNKRTFYMHNGVKKDTIIDIDESLFGFELKNLGKTSKVINDSIFFLLNEGQGYTYSDIMKMTTSDRLYNIDKLSEKIKQINSEMNK